MLIECLIQRDGHTLVSLEKFNYIFREQKDLTGSDTAKVCEVNSKSHSDYLLAMPAMYREFVREIPSPVQEKKPEKPKAPVTTDQQQTPAPGDAPQSTGRPLTEEPPSTEEPPLTVESFFKMTSMPNIKGVLKKCTDKELLTKIGDIENMNTKPRTWLLNFLNARLDELEPAGDDQPASELEQSPDQVSEQPAEQEQPSTEEQITELF